MARRTRPGLQRRAMSFVPAMLIAVGAIPALAQEPNVRLSEPQAWRDGQRLEVTAGQTVRVRGFAFHPGGVREVLINGTVMALVPDPPIVRFEHAITADAQRREVTIAVVPMSGQRYEVRYSIDARAPTPNTDSLRALAIADSLRKKAIADSLRKKAIADSLLKARAVSDSLLRTQAIADSLRAKAFSDSVKAPEMIGRVPEARVGNPWGGFKVRALLYGATAVGGAVLGVGTSSSSAEECRGPPTAQDCFLVTTKEPSFAAGVPLAGVAIAAAILDFAMTSRRAKAVSRSTASRAELYLNVTATPSQSRITLHVMRLKF